ncbi:hypothetical protein [Sulfitobacter mediterraneus]|uniref:hypothetical protein n=1 Tax=Sulfitobacter mediterraneus TaxID=83219 RepID=UPI0021A64945|nr:hypothetical protein [Sulfitobacter mediterraneus]UWR10601.1 hypothetical protein K3753_15310 [Sulfitobacter mediterraneus]
MTLKNDMEELDGWISKHCKEFATVPGNVKAAAYYFMILWSVFDRRHLHSNGGREDVEKYCAEELDEVPFEPFQIYWDYYQDRFAVSTGANENFEDLVGNNYQTRQKLEPIIAAQQGTPKDKLSALVWITYLLRCNLVHGAKHEKGISDQYGNLMNGAKLMTEIMNLKLKPVG